MTKINLRIISKLYAHLQTLKKAPVKFQKDRHKTIGELRTQGTYCKGGGGTGGGGRTTEPLNYGKPNTMSHAFLRKGGGQQISYIMTGIRTLDKHYAKRPLELNYLQGQHAEPKASFQPCKRVLG